MKYLNEFLSLKCAGDALNAVNGMRKGAKEITESMSIIHAIRSITLKEPMKYTLIDLCAGNALTGIIAVHLLPIKQAIAFDKHKRKCNYNHIKRFTYIKADIIKETFSIPKKSIIVSVHPCKGLALHVIDIYNSNTFAEHLAMMPCCIGKITGFPERMIKKLGKYEVWCYQLSIQANGTYKQDRHCLSPVNCVITASKGANNA